jgi:hypothetical protein
LKDVALTFAEDVGVLRKQCGRDYPPAMIGLLEMRIGKQEEKLR